jgi:hypothetical protein
MTLSGLDVLFFTVTFVVPGFVLSSVMSMFAPRKADEPQRALLRFLTFSCWNYAPWSWLIYLQIQAGSLLTNPSQIAATLFLVAFVSPVCLGVACGYVSHKGLLRKAFQRIGLNPVHGTPTAWDDRFYRIDRAIIVRVTLKDGSAVTGVFGSKSFASSEPDDRDLYLEEILKVDDGRPQRLPQRVGMLLRGDQIKCIEFWDENRGDRMSDNERKDRLQEGYQPMPVPGRDEVADVINHDQKGYQPPPSPPPDIENIQVGHPNLAPPPESASNSGE